MITLRELQQIYISTPYKVMLHNQELEQIDYTKEYKVLSMESKVVQNGSIITIHIEEEENNGRNRIIQDTN